MENKNSLITGTFNKILWSSTDGSIVIATFKVLTNDGATPVSLNKFNSISITIKNNLFNENNIILNTQNYQVSVSPAIKSKYPNSYVLNSVDLVDDNESYQKSYIVKFLKSAKFKGIGEQRAWAIVDKLGADALKKIANDNGEIDYKEIGINSESWEVAKEYLKSNPTLVEDQILFLKLNLSTSLYEEIIKRFKNFDGFYQKYKDNFYLYYLDSDNYKIKLDDMDKLTDYFNFDKANFKGASHIYKALNDYFFDSGNTRIQRRYIYNEIIRVASIDLLWPRELNKFEEAIDLLIQSNYLIKEDYDGDEFISTKKIYEMEKFIIQRLYKIKNNSGLKKINFEDEKLLHQYQNEAIKSALEDNLVLITGGPGTGKTLITNRIINKLLEIYHEDSVAILTPTGRATININNNQEEAKAVTIHSFLEWDPDNNNFSVNEKSPKAIDCLIIDEFSMVSVDLFNALLKGISSRYLKKIILVGDKNQLPAIGPGYLIHDFIDNNIFKTIELKKVYRQQDNIDIIDDAMAINEGKMPEFAGNNSKFIEVKREDLHVSLINIVKDLVNKGYNKKDIAILSPMYNYETGIDELNNVLSAYFRLIDNQDAYKYRERTFAIDDKVINLVNDSKTKVFNGEIGYISWFTFVNKKDSFEKDISHITVEYDDKSVTYTKSEFLANTYPAYCTSVHKYQGSECKVVITVLFSEAKRLLSKKLIYTAITRAKNYSVILGETETLKTGISNDSDSNRITNIAKLWAKEKEE
ncbi:ATP-dependent RecD-like DNA helicase [Metamycoplasma spumans]|uniref:ATP-dependent DNA helicase n=1 Tax=Metamycoplasma spumans TaxID=92406 RepID=UPI0034DD8484